jgi:hypothetical protein
VRHIRFDKQALVAMDPEFWEKWERAAENATRQAIAEAEAGTPGFNQKVWKDLKDWLLQHVFDGKCAYCESTISGSSYGDAEHWRPKGAVSTLPDDEEVTPVTGENNRGYYWLAYRSENLLPACEKCNTLGKGTLFPIEGEYCTSHQGATDIKELDRRERPLILHPYSDDALPEEHIEFDVLGNAVPANGSRLGLRSIKVFKLCRPDLVTDRRKHVKLMEPAINDALIKLRREGIPLDQSLKDWVGPDARFSRAAWWYAHLQAKKFIDDLKADLNGSAVPGAGPVQS